MKKLNTATVTRYQVELDPEECELMKSFGMLPPHALEPARLWFTEAELQEMEKQLVEMRRIFKTSEKALNDLKGIIHEQSNESTPQEDQAHGDGPEVRRPEPR
jgi:hypothetical protein